MDKMRTARLVEIGRMECEEIEISPTEIADIQKISQREDLVELFVRSIAPSIIVGEEKMNWIKNSKKNFKKEN